MEALSAMAVARMRDVNSDGLVVLVKLSEQKNEECSADGPGRILRMLAGQFVPFNFFLSSDSEEGGGAWIMSLRGPGHCGGQTSRLTALMADGLTCKCLAESTSVE